MSYHMSKIAFVFIASAALMGTAVAQDANTTGPGRDTSTLAGPAQKVGPSNQKAGMKKMKMSKKKHKKMM